MANPEYPVFLDPEGYTKLRVSHGPLGRLKSWSEHRALNRCLSATSEIRSVLDVPCGPGRLYHYWARRGYKVTGMDMSEPMVGAASATRARLGIDGEDSKGDAFKFEDSPPIADLVASVRFVYYFEPDQRIALFRSLSAAARRYVLAQYKTSSTYKGQRNDAKLRRKKGKKHSKHFASIEQVLSEVRAAGLAPLRIEPIGEFSDRAFLIAEKLPQGAAAPEVHITKPPGGLWAGLLRAVSPPPAA